MVRREKFLRIIFCIRKIDIDNTAALAYTIHIKKN